MKPLLTIRSIQMSALTEVVESSWLRARIATLYPVQSAAMGSQGLDVFVSAARERARSHGFTSRDHLSYISLEMTFGQDFMREDWARRALDGEPDTLMQRLRHEAIFLLAQQADDAERQEEADQAVAPPDDEPPVEGEPLVALFEGDATLEGEEGQ